MRVVAFSVRNAKEILRDPVNLIFGLGFPVGLLLLLSAIQANVPVALFEIHRLTPGITVFGLSFLTLFSSLILAKDRQSAFLQRLYSSPMRPIEFLLGYALPLIPMGLVQVIVCYLTAVCLGFTISVEILFATLLSLPGIVFFIGLGLFFGSFLTDKQVGGICGALVTNVTALMSGAWFDLTLVGGGFETVANLLPFVHAVEIQRAVVSGVYTDFFVHLAFVVGYAVVIFGLATWLFLRQMKKH